MNKNVYESGFLQVVCILCKIIFSCGVSHCTDSNGTVVVLVVKVLAVMVLVVLLLLKLVRKE